MIIGIVLPDVPQYSETFFSSKIKILEEAGIKVMVFGGSRNTVRHNFRYSGAYPVYKSNKLKQYFLIFCVIAITFIRSPIRSVKLFNAEKRDGNSSFESLKTLYLNAHILPYKLDWIHFGFATMALKRENIGSVTGAKTGVSFRGYDINIYPLKNPGCYQKLWKKADKVHSISKYLYRRALSAGLSPATDYEIISPSVDTSYFRMRVNAGELKTPLRILTIGRLNWIKNYETAISAMKILKDRNIEFKYEIVGTGSEYERLKFAVYQCGLNDNIIFTGKIDHGKVRNKMYESDIYLQTSYQEGFCVSVLEAQSTGMLCVVSNADGLMENIIDGETGWIVNKRNPQEFADKITEILNMPSERRKEIVTKAADRVKKEYDTKEQRKKFLNFYNN
ncbi:MAG: glycosyltransferase family 4 protein [Ignavibacteria bacterium]|nr:glycosyltransferase family 4 protein [Ignavibacteria bacterium]